MKNLYTKLTMIRLKVIHFQKNSAKITLNQCFIQFTTSYSFVEEINVSNHNIVHSIMFMKKKLLGMIHLLSILRKSEMYIQKEKNNKQ